MASKTERTIINGPAGAGHRPGDIPRGQHHLHGHKRVRAVQHPVRGHVPAAGRAGHRHVAAWRRAGPPDLRQACLPARPGLQHRRDGAAGQHAGQEKPGSRVSDAPVATRQAATNSCKRSSRYRALAQNRSWKPCPNRTADSSPGPGPGLALCFVAEEGGGTIVLIWKPAEGGGDLPSRGSSKCRVADLDGPACCWRRWRGVSSASRRFAW
jgi:hypothetical protein